MTVLFCALAATRTPNLLLRKQALYPIELRGQAYRKVILPRRVSGVKISVFIPLSSRSSMWWQVIFTQFLHGEWYSFDKIVLQ